ncbi:MAG: peptide chain release factor 3, partial [Actinomycetota bacterium]|nr:peptide chain release factor 3 [Actinomycetota bacterium]
ISHPDAGKTTLTEKFLLYSGQISEAGSVKARSGRKSATSDWMELEQQRGISITSTALQFDYRDCVLNLLDTPGHRDFSEDTYRVLAATDAAVMVLDGSKGIESQTLKLFEVCRQREVPILTFVNKCDRPGRPPLELIDEIENMLQLLPMPMSWPVGVPGDLRGIVDRTDGSFISYNRTAHGATESSEQRCDIDQVDVVTPGWDEASEELELLEALGTEVDVKGFLAGEVTPVFFGSALTNFGVRLLLDSVVDLAPTPGPRFDVDSAPRPVEAPFSAFAFKVQANTDKAHRDRIAYVRVCSGHFQRGMGVTQTRTGRPFATKYAHTMFGSERSTVDEAWPGDVVALVNATDVRVGDTLYSDEAVEYPPIPPFAPEIFKRIRVTDTNRFKQFRRGLVQLDEEGVIQVLRDEEVGDVEPVLAAVGLMQFDVAVHRLENEFGAPVALTNAPYSVARRTDEASANELKRLPGATVLARSDGALLALFENEFYLQRVQNEKEHLTLERVLAEQEWLGDGSS